MYCIPELGYSKFSTKLGALLLKYTMREVDFIT